MKNSRRILIAMFTVAIAFSLILQNCGSSKSGSTEEAALNDAPEWFLNVPTEDGFIYGTGMAKKQNPSLAREAAIARARANVAGQVQVRVQGMLRDFMQESGVGENAQALEFTENVTKQVTDLDMQSSYIREVHLGRDGTIYALIEYPLDAVRESALTEAQREEALYNEFKAKQSFKDLEKAIEDLK